MTKAAKRRTVCSVLMVIFAVSATALATIAFGIKIGALVFSLLLFSVTLAAAVVWMAIDAHHKMRWGKEPD